MSEILWFKLSAVWKGARGCHCLHAISLWVLQHFRLASAQAIPCPVASHAPWSRYRSFPSHATTHGPKGELLATATLSDDPI